MSKNQPLLFVDQSSTIFAAYEVRISPVLTGNGLAYLQLDEEVLLVHRATGTIAHTGNMDECIKVDATRYCNMAYVLEDKSEPSCQGAVWRSEWSEATQRCPIRMVRARATVWAKDEFLVVCQTQRNVHSPAAQNLPRQDN
jgi:hypothetical protein